VCLILKCSNTKLGKNLNSQPTHSRSTSLVHTCVLSLMYGEYMYASFECMCRFCGFAHLECRQFAHLECTNICTSRVYEYMYASFECMCRFCVFAHLECTQFAHLECTNICTSRVYEYMYASFECMCRFCVFAHLECTEFSFMCMSRSDVCLIMYAAVPSSEESQFVTRSFWACSTCER